MIQKCLCGKLMKKIVKGPLGMSLCKCDCGRVASAGKKLNDKQRAKLKEMNEEVSHRERRLYASLNMLHCACCGAILTEETAVECPECEKVVCTSCFDAEAGTGCQCHGETPGHFVPSDQEVMDGMVTKNACTCGICGAKADRYLTEFRCQEHGHHLGNLKTGLFLDTEQAAA